MVGAGWRWMELGEAGGCWMELGGAGWKLVHGLVIPALSLRFF